VVALLFRSRLILGTDEITVLVDNPKKKGSASRKRFDLYGGKGATITVAEYVAKAGKSGIGNLAWGSDPRRKFVVINKAMRPAA
jgi:hypothetical protein